MLPTLWFGNASSTPTELTIREGEQILGRAADADLCLSESFVSTYHARLIWQRGQLKVLDLNSTNGTFVNGVPVVGWTTLTDGDVIEFGGIEAVVTLPTVVNLDEPHASFPPPQRRSHQTTEEIPRVVADGADGVASIGHQPPDDAPASPNGTAPVTLPPTLPTGITITDIEAVTEGYGDFSGGGIVDDLVHNRPFGDTHPESVRGRGQHRRPILEDPDGSDGQRRHTPAFSREGVSPLVIIIAVAMLVVVILAAVFFA